jgi:hypothetical protein
MMSYTRSVVIGIFILMLLVPNFTGYSRASREFKSESFAKIITFSSNKQESYEPALFAKLKSIPDLIRYIDTSYKGDRNSYHFTKYMGEVVSRRFYHGYSYYNQDDNWIAALAGRYVRGDLSAIVIPDDIMKYPYAACSQQSIIMMTVAKQFGFTYRNVGFDHHYTTEIWVGNKWHYVDPDLEVITENESFLDLLHRGEFYKVYDQRLPANEVSFLLGHPRFGKPNENPAPNAEKFHRVTGWFSEYFICILFVFMAVIYFKFFLNDSEILTSADKWTFRKSAKS